MRHLDTEAGATGLLAYLAHGWKHMVLGVGGHPPKLCLGVFQDVPRLIQLLGGHAAPSA